MIYLQETDSWLFHFLKDLNERSFYGHNTQNGVMCWSYTWPGIEYKTREDKHIYIANASTVNALVMRYIPDRL